ncbi:hypothetical protein ACHAQH_006360 [Verticillium albo-atrum]
MYLWRWSEGLQAVELPPIHREIASQHEHTGFMFHPTNPMLFSIATLNITSNGTTNHASPSTSDPTPDPKDTTYNLHFHVSDYNDRSLITTKTHNRPNLPAASSAFCPTLHRNLAPGGSSPSPVRLFHHPLDARGGHAFFASDPAAEQIALASYNIVTRRLDLTSICSKPDGPHDCTFWRAPSGNGSSELFLWGDMLYVQSRVDDLSDRRRGSAALERFLRCFDVNSGNWARLWTLRIPEGGFTGYARSFLHGDDRYVVLSNESSDSYVVWRFDDWVEAGWAEGGDKLKAWLNCWEVR